MLSKNNIIITNILLIIIAQTNHTYCYLTNQQTIAIASASTAIVYGYKIIKKLLYNEKPTSTNHQFIQYTKNEITKLKKHPAYLHSINYMYNSANTIDQSQYIKQCAMQFFSNNIYPYYEYVIALHDTLDDIQSLKNKITYQIKYSLKHNKNSNIAIAQNKSMILLLSEIISIEKIVHNFFNIVINEKEYLIEINNDRNSLFIPLWMKMHRTLIIN